MKILKITLYLLILVSIVLLIVAGVLPSNYKISRTETIQAPINVVYSNVVDLKKWKSWDSSIASDPGAENNFLGPKRGLNQKHEWNGTKVGVGEQTIKDAVENETIETELILYSPFSMRAKGNWVFIKADDGVHVTWSVEGELSYPFKRFLGLTLDGRLGTNFEKGLQKLKNVTEKMAADSNIPNLNEF